MGGESSNVDNHDVVMTARRTRKRKRRPRELEMKRQDSKRMRSGPEQRREIYQRKKDHEEEEEEEIDIHEVKAGGSPWSRMGRGGAGLVIPDGDGRWPNRGQVEVGQDAVVGWKGV